MLTLPKINRRGWLASWLQGRRRKRQQPPPPQPNAPVIVGGGFEWDATEAGFADVWVDWTFDHGSLAVAAIEVWARTGDQFFLVNTVPSTDPGYYYARACETETAFEIKARYRNGATVGPFSNVYVVDVQV